MFIDFINSRMCESERMPGETPGIQPILPTRVLLIVLITCLTVTPIIKFTRAPFEWRSASKTIFKYDSAFKQFMGPSFLVNPLRTNH